MFESQEAYNLNGKFSLTFTMSIFSTKCNLGAVVQRNEATMALFKMHGYYPSVAQI